MSRLTSNGYETAANVGLRVTAASHVLAAAHQFRLGLLRWSRLRLLTGRQRLIRLRRRLMRRHKRPASAVATGNVINHCRNRDANHRHLVFENGRSGSHGWSTTSSSSHTVVLITRLTLLLVFLANHLVGFFVLDRLATRCAQISRFGQVAWLGLRQWLGFRHVVLLLWLRMIRFRNVEFRLASWLIRRNGSRLQFHFRSFHAKLSFAAKFRLMGFRFVIVFNWNVSSSRRSQRRPAEKIFNITFELIQLFACIAWPVVSRLLTGGRCGDHIKSAVSAISVG